MKIRSVTVFAQLGFPINHLLLSQLGIFGNHAKHAFMEAGYEVQSLRLATPSFDLFIAPQDLSEAASTYSVEAHGERFQYISMGPAPLWKPGYNEAMLSALERTDNIFFSGYLTTTDGKVSLQAAKACAEMMVALSKFEPSGFANLRFCGLANVAPFAPFFPASYGLPGRPSFALALEAADLAVEAFTNASSLEEAGQLLIRKIEENAARLEQIANKLSQMYKYAFNGLDFTLAPFPDDAASIGTALEKLGLPAFGQHGSLFASAFLTSTLDQARYQRVGFNGLMLPVLEDSRLALRAAEAQLSVADLLMCSAVCGTGLDVIPLPGETTPEEIYPVLLDLAALSLRLNKPLTARLMPIPGKKVGEPTEFNFGYFANSRVMPLRSLPLSGMLNKSETVPILFKNNSPIK